MKRQIELDQERAKITDLIKDYNDILKMSGVSAEDDKVSILGFNDEENEMVSVLIQIMRTKKIYNHGWVPKHGQKRYFAWYDTMLGFQFRGSDYNDSLFTTGSASRLTLKTKEDCDDYVKKFSYLDKDFIGLK